MAETLLSYETNTQAEASLTDLPAEILLQICTHTSGPHRVPTLTTKELIALSCSAKSIRLKMLGLLLLDKMEDVVADVSLQPRNFTTKKASFGNAEVERRLKRVAQLYRRTSPTESVKPASSFRPLGVVSFLCFVTVLILDGTNVEPSFLGDTVLPRAYNLSVLSLNGCPRLTAVDLAILLETAVERRSRKGAGKEPEFHIPKLGLVRVRPLLGPGRPVDTQSDRIVLQAVRRILAAVETLREAESAEKRQDIVVEPWPCEHCNGIASYFEGQTEVGPSLAKGRCFTCFQDRFCAFCGVFGTDSLFDEDEAKEIQDELGTYLEQFAVFQIEAYPRDRLFLLCEGLGMSCKSYSLPSSRKRRVWIHKCKICNAAALSACRSCSILNGVPMDCQSCKSWYCQSCSGKASVLSCSSGCGRSFCVKFDCSGCYIRHAVISKNASKVNEREIVCGACSQHMFQ